MKLRSLLSLGLVFAMLFSFAKADPVKVGDKAPEITGTTETGAKLNLADVYKKHQYTLVYFYPKAFTGGCTTQGCSLRDAYAELTKRGVEVIGVSMDTVDVQKSFKDEHKFPFTLIADPDKAVINAFGVPAARLASRQAYLIKDGKIIYTDYKGTTTDQGAVIIQFIDGQKG